eukprot:SAG31_NODE_3584_length_4100_cov_1.957761_3_plen_79_part_00
MQTMPILKIFSSSTIFLEQRLCATNSMRACNNKSVLDDNCRLLIKLRVPQRPCCTGALCEPESVQFSAAWRADVNHTV